jgi:hypothetical protein
MADFQLNFTIPQTQAIAGAKFTAIALELDANLKNEVPVDTGELRDTEVTTIEGVEASYYYPADYAIYVHEGHVTRSGSQVPANQWTERAAAQLRV